MNEIYEAQAGDGDAPTSHQIKLTVHPDLYAVIADYADNHDVSIAAAATDICAIGAETTEGRAIRGRANTWGGSRPGAGRPSADKDNERKEA